MPRLVGRLLARAAPRLSVGVSFGLLLSLSLACEDVPTVTPVSSGPGGGVGAAPPGGGGGGSDGKGGGNGSTGGADVAPVYLGVRANVASGSPPALAELRAFAAGVRLVPLEVSFEGFDEAALQNQLAAYAEQNLRVVLTLLVVDGERAHRPLEGLAWNDPLVKASLVDALASITEPVEVVVLGRRADVYLEANPSESDALVELFAHAFTAGPDMPLGVGLSHGPLEADAATLAELGPVSVRSYLPGLGASSYSPSPVAMDLDALAVAAGERPVLLHDVGFSSDIALTSSEDSQQQELDAFFSALGSRRARFPWVVIHQLYDLDAEGCAALAADQGEDPAGSWADFACHTGLRTALDEPKPAWSRFLEATAGFATP